MVAGDRLPDRIGIGVLTKVFPPELVDRVVDEAGVREQRKRALPARVVVYLLLAMVLFFGSGYGQVWDKLVRGLEWARTFRVRVALGMQPSPAAITLARRRLGWQGCRCSRSCPTARTYRGSPARPPPGGCAARARIPGTSPASRYGSSSTR